MFEAVRQNKRIAQAILALISLTFVFWGVDSYLSDRTSTAEVASVGNIKISAFEFQDELRKQQDRMRSASESPIDAATFKSPLFKRAVLDNLINQRVLAIYAAEHYLSVSDKALYDAIANISAFQEDGQFSMERYERALRGQGMNIPTFQERVRAELTNQQVITAVSEAAVVPDSVISRFLGAQLEARTVHMVQLKAEDFAAGVQVDEAAAKAFYEQNAGDFSIPARVKARYVMLTPDAVKQQVSVTDDEIRAEYEQRKDTLGNPEERKASHILVEVAADAPEADVAKAGEKAQKLLDTLKASPEQFESLAKAESDDPGSAAEGGNLGFFGRGAMLAAFEDAAFAVDAPGLIPKLVRSDFGFHIIRVDEIRRSTTPAFDDVKAQIRTDLVDAAANRRFLEVAEQFANMVYEQPDSLGAAAEAFGLDIHTTKDWIEADATGIDGHESPALVKALFSDDVLRDKHNTDAIDIGGNTMIAARVEEAQPARQKAFEEVKADVEDRLRLQEAAKAAATEGESRLAKLRAGETLALDWGDKIELQRGVPALPPQMMTEIFAVNDGTLPAYAGMTLPGAGYAVFRIDSVKKTDVAKDDPRLKAIDEQYAQLLGAQDLRAFVGALREKYTVKINASALASEEG